MAKKITRLGDPNNPYGRKVSAAEAAQSKKMSDMTTPKRSKPAAKAKKSASLPDPFDRMKAAGSAKTRELNDRYGGGARKRAIDDAIEGRTSRRK